MRLDDKIRLKVATEKIDEFYNRKEEVSWLELGKCCILPNGDASETEGEYNKIRSYNFIVFMRLPKTRYPKEGDVIHLSKKGGSVDTDATVTGFVVLRNWLKLWVSQ